MHETAVAHHLLIAIKAEAEKYDAEPISARISCGLMSAVNDEILQLAFEAITKGTVCEGMKLEIEHKELQARCKQCQKEFEVDFESARCPQCQSEDLELLPDPPLLLENIEFSED